MAAFISLLQYLGNNGPLAIFLGAWLFFALLYFGSAVLSLFFTRYIFPHFHFGHVIDNRPLKPNQVRFEILHSLSSITIFAGYGVLMYFLHRKGEISLVWEASPSTWLPEIFVLFLWNELHFYLCHRLLHTPWLLRHIHRIHHHSIVPTPFSTFSFHWAEATLLGSVMVLAMLAHHFSIHALLALPLMSIVGNSIGHSNYSFTRGRMTASGEHSLHHRRASGNFGFLLSWFDRLSSTRLDSQQEG